MHVLVYLRVIPKYRSTSMTVVPWSLQTQHVQWVSIQQQGRKAGLVPRSSESLTALPTLIRLRYSRPPPPTTGKTKLAEVRLNHMRYLRGNRTRATISLATKTVPTTASQRMETQVILRLVCKPRQRSIGLDHLNIDITFDLHPP